MFELELEMGIGLFLVNRLTTNEPVQTVGSPVQTGNLRTLKNMDKIQKSKRLFATKIWHLFLYAFYIFYLFHFFVAISIQKNSKTKICFYHQIFILCAFHSSHLLLCFLAISLQKNQYLADSAVKRECFMLMCCPHQKIAFAGYADFGNACMCIFFSLFFKERANRCCVLRRRLSC